MAEDGKSLHCLQAGRGIAAVLVLVNHLSWYFSRDPLYWGRPAFEHLAFGSLGVSFFFVLSGLVMLLAHWKDLRRPASLGRYAAKRFRRIFPIYWIVLLPAVCAFMLHPVPGRADARNPLTLLSAITLVHFQGNDLILLVSWTLFHEVLFYCLFALLLWRVWLGAVVLGAWFLVGAAMSVHSFGSAVVREDLSSLHLLFLAGMLITVLFKRGIKVPHWWVIGLGSALFLYAALRVNQEQAAPEGMLLLAGLGSFFVTLGLVQMESQGRLRVPGWLDLLGDASYSIYLIHFPLLSVGLRLVFLISRRLALPLAVWFCLLAVFTTAAGVVFHLLVERPLLQKLSGRRVLGRTATSRLEGAA